MDRIQRVTQIRRERGLSLPEALEVERAEREGEHMATHVGAHGYSYSNRDFDAIHALMEQGRSFRDAAIEHGPNMGINDRGAWNREDFRELATLCAARRLERGEQALLYIIGSELVEPGVAPVTRAPRVRVTVVANGYGDWDIDVRQDGDRASLPSTKQLKPFIPQANRQGIRWSSYAHSFVSCVTDSLTSGSLPSQVLADALKAYFVAKLAQPQSVESVGDVEEDTALMRMQPATLLVGGAAYRLVPTGSADMRAPLRNIRKRAREVAQAEAQSLQANATRDAQLTVRRAEERAGEIRAQIEAERARASITVPTWLLESGRMFAASERAGRWEVGLSCQTVIEDIVMAVPNWALTLHWTPLPIPANIGGPSQFSMVLNLLEEGRYNLDLVSVSEGEWEAPHISYRCCMKLEGLPKVINSLETLKKLEAAIGRGMKVINLNSLLSYATHQYHPWILAQIPESVRKIIRSARRDSEWPSRYSAGVSRANLNPEMVTWQAEVPFAQEAAEVFTLAEEVRR